MVGSIVTSFRSNADFLRNNYKFMNTNRTEVGTKHGREVAANIRAEQPIDKVIRSNLPPSVWCNMKSGDTVYACLQLETQEVDIRIGCYWWKREECLGRWWNKNRKAKYFKDLYSVEWGRGIEWCPGYNQIAKPIQHGCTTGNHGGTLPGWPKARVISVYIRQGKWDRGISTKESFWDCLEGRHAEKC